MESCENIWRLIILTPTKKKKKNPKRQLNRLTEKTKQTKKYKAKHWFTSLSFAAEITVTKSASLIQHTA